MRGEKITLGTYPFFIMVICDKIGFKADIGAIERKFGVVVKCKKRKNRLFQVLQKKFNSYFSNVS